MTSPLHLKDGEEVGASAADAGHTPGPWFNLRPNARDGFATIGTKGPNGPTRHIAEACWHDEQGKADARLIAAAPELLEALQEARGNIAHPMKPGAELLCRIDDAIAKATGNPSPNTPDTGRIA